MKHLNRATRIILITVVCVAAVIGLIVGVLLIIKKTGQKPVNVYSVQSFSMTDYWGDATETYGTVRTENMQNVYVSKTQTITQIYVSEGQSVKKGDKLLSFDTTLSDLELQKQDIEILRLQNNLNKAKQELSVINTLKPYTPPPEPTPTPTPTPETPGTPPELLAGSGTKDDPYIFLWDDTCEYTASFITSLFDMKRLDTASTDLQVVWVSFEEHQDNVPNAELLLTWGFCFTETGADTYTFTIFDPEVVYDPDNGGTGGDTETPVDTSSGYTSSEIAKMKKEKQEQIRDLDVNIRLAQVERARIALELTDGNIYADTDGVVKTLIDYETAVTDNKPMLVVSGGGGYYVTGALSELDINSVQIGQSVTVTSWENYGTFEGTITAISDYPTTSSSSSGTGNTNVSYYPFTIFIDESATLRQDEYVSVSYTTQQKDENSFYLEVPFVRSENGKNYVYLRDGDGLLKKTEITTGKNVWGSYVEILSGVTLDDWVAFPYGSAVKDGATTQEATPDDLYAGY